MKKLSLIAFLTVASCLMVAAQTFTPYPFGQPSYSLQGSSSGGGSGAAFVSIPLSASGTNVAVGTVTNAIITYSLICSTNVFIQNPSVDASVKNGQTIKFQVKANVTNSVVWDTKFRWGGDVTGYTPSVAIKTDYIGAAYNTTDDKWDIISISRGY